MSIIRTKRKKNNFSIIDNTGLIDPDLTWKETGLLAFLMTKPDDWEVSIKSLSNNKQDKRDSVATAIAGLQKKGYVYRKDSRDEKGRFKVEYLVFETKEDLQIWLKENPQTPEQTGTGKPERENRNGKTVTGKPERENRNGRTVTGKPDQVITDIDITDQQITDQQITGREGAHAIAQALTPTVQISKTEPEPESPLELEQTDFTVAQTPELPIEPITFPLEQNSPAPLTKAETTADRVRRVYQETGILPRIPAELEAWVEIDLGSEIVASYRNSGRITTTKRGDIQPSFA
ncbi:MAG: helix-turn-helix domain-containing protein, partial [Sphaerospermopsis kisseleviana]